MITMWHHHYKGEGPFHCFHGSSTPAVNATPQTNRQNVCKSNPKSSFKDFKKYFVFYISAGQQVTSSVWSGSTQHTSSKIGPFVLLLMLFTSSSQIDNYVHLFFL